MSKIKNALLILTLGLVLNGSASWAENKFIQLSPQQIDNLGITMGHLETTSHVPLFTAPAKVIVPPAHDFIVSVSQAGLVVKMNVSAGDKVTKGEILGLVNSPDFLTLQGDYLKAVGALKLAKATYERDKKLRKEGVVSGRNEQASFSSYQAAMIEANETRQLLQIAGMSVADLKQLDRSGHLLSQISVRSPITGRVIERMAATGAHVDAMSPLYRVANLDELWLEINVPQEHIDDIQIGDKVQVEDSVAEAQISVLGQSVNPENQSILVRAVITAHPSALKVGQKVTIRHMQANDDVTYKLPNSAIANHEGNFYIFIKDPTGFKVSEVKVLGKQAEETVISGQLTGDETVAIGNTAVLKAVWLGLGSGE